MFLCFECYEEYVAKLKLKNTNGQGHHMFASWRDHMSGQPLFFLVQSGQCLNVVSHNFKV